MVVGVDGTAPKLKFVVLFDNEFELFETCDEPNTNGCGRVLFDDVVVAVVEVLPKVNGEAGA